jgi:hypothetical protein
MSGKGDKRRPSLVPDQQISNNWDRIFNKENKDLKYESDNPLERPFEPRDMWVHLCPKCESGLNAISVGVGQACNWCGKYEDGTSD